MKKIGNETGTIMQLKHGYLMEKRRFSLDRIPESNRFIEVSSADNQINKLRKIVFNARSRDAKSPKVYSMYL